MFSYFLGDWEILVLQEINYNMIRFDLVLVPIMFIAIFILATFRSKYRLKRLFQDHVEIYLIENKYKLIGYKAISKLTLGKSEFKVRPHFSTGSPFSTTIFRVDVEDDHNRKKFFEVKITTVFGALEEVKFFEKQRD
ncbi:hypothetical protein [Sphingobacterium sp. WOUb80]|uniref:hypothetical protein n=1 Tax=Sphingobacterium sp. WOUb80 TaxID=3234028 RepID=UPI003CF396B0